jgi:hypothetical protein
MILGSKKGTGGMLHLGMRAAKACKALCRIRLKDDMWEPNLRVK